MSWLYLLVIVGSTAGVTVVDHRWRLCLFAQPARTVVTVVAGVGFFLTWDLVAIALDIYRRGESSAMTGIEFARDLPLEEVFFVLFLCYLTLVLHRLLAMVLDRVARSETTTATTTATATTTETTTDELSR